MTTLDLNDASALTKLLCICDKDGRPALRVGLLATMFITEPWTRSAREAVVDVAEEYLRQFRDHLRWAHNPKTKHIRPLDESKVPFPSAWLPQHEDGKAWQFGFFGGEHAKGASVFQVSGYGGDNVMRGRGYVQVHLPLTWLTEHPDMFQDFVLSAAKRLRPLSGYAGIGVLQPLDFHAAEPDLATVREIAERFPGLEIENPAWHVNYIDKGIKGVNWLTLLGNRWVEEIGGLDYLRIRLGEDFKLRPYDGGLMIQAGPRPQIGDVTTNRWPQHYVTLAKVLKPIQIKVHGAFHFGDPTGSQKRMDHEASLAWLFRFDGK